MEIETTLAAMVQEADENLAKLKSLRVQHASGRSVPHKSASGNERSKTPISSARNVFRAARDKEISSSSHANQIDSLTRRISDLESTCQQQAADVLTLRGDLSKFSTQGAYLSDAVVSTHNLAQGTAGVVLPQIQADIKSLRQFIEKNRESDSTPRNNASHEYKGISEEIFQRVHREFNSVVSDVVKSCVKEQNDRIAESVRTYISTLEAHHNEQKEKDASEISALKAKNAALESRLREVESALSHQDISFDRIQKVAVKTYRQEVQVVLENMSKKVNECLAANKSFAEVEKPADIERRVVSAVQGQLLSLCAKLESRSSTTEGAVKALVAHSQSVDDALVDVRQGLFRAETMASHALNVIGDESRERRQLDRHSDCVFLHTAAGQAASVCPDNYDILHSQQQKLLEVVAALETESANGISRLNSLIGTVDKIKEDAIFTKGALVEKIESLKSKLVTDQNFIDRVVESPSTRKSPSEALMLRGEVSKCLTDVSNLRSQYQYLTKKLITRAEVKKLMIEVLQSESPVPRVLLDESNMDIDSDTSHGIAALDPAPALFRPVPFVLSSEATPDKAVEVPKDNKVIIDNANKSDAVEVSTVEVSATKKKEETPVHEDLKSFPKTPPAAASSPQVLVNTSGSDSKYTEEKGLSIIEERGSLDVDVLDKSVPIASVHTYGSADSMQSVEDAERVSAAILQLKQKKKLHRMTFQMELLRGQQQQGSLQK